LTATPCRSQQAPLPNLSCAERIRTLSNGTFFGEISLLTGERRNATVRAITTCELLVLSKEDFGMLLEQIPNASEQFHAIAQWRIASLRQCWGDDLTPLRTRSENSTPSRMTPSRVTQTRAQDS
jgi:CRP-like cAMP-binding protein